MEPALQQMRQHATDHATFGFHGISVALRWREVVVRTLPRIGLVVVIPIFMVCVLITPQLTRASRIDVRVDTVRTFPTNENTASQSPHDQQMKEADGPVDLYGNEVTDAVAKYTFDATGSLYETHSPQTELPRLGSPKS